MKKLTKKSKKKAAKKAKKGYKRGSLRQAIFALFEEHGVENVSLKKAMAVAKKVKSDTPYNQAHHAWYKNQFNNEED